MNQKLNIRIPSLPFGNRSAATDYSAIDMTRCIEAAMPWRVQYSAIGNDDSFMHRAASVDINGMRMTASANTPMQVQVSEAANISLLISFHGKSIRSFDGQKFIWETGKKACLIPKAASFGECSARSVLILDIEPDRMEAVVGAMLGLAVDQLPAFDWQRLHLLDVNVGNISFDAMYRHQASMIDTLIGQPHLLSISGLDDVLYRITAMMLYPDLFLKHFVSVKMEPRCHGALATLTEYIAANLNTQLTLTRLEQVSGLSARALQYHFRQRFACTPMQWISQQRVDVARIKLLHPDPMTSVTSVATGFGFANLGNFSRVYADRIGELPSVTLRRGLARQ